MERAYTVRELDELRQALKRKEIFGLYADEWHLGMQDICYNDKEVNERVETLVRTHMLAGHTAEDLIASEVAV